MGRIIRKFTARTYAGRVPAFRVQADGKIDSGADRTVLSLDVACRLGFDPSAEPPTDAMRTASNARIEGYSLPVCIEIGDRSACVDAFVPVGVENPRNLIGADFLQGAKAKIDYSKPDDEAFSGSKAEAEVGGGWCDFAKLTPEERAALRPSAPCRTRRPRPKKRHR